MLFATSMTKRPRTTYAVDYKGATHLRPYMLCWRADAGCSGYIEPEISVVIMELMALEGLWA